MIRKITDRQDWEFFTNVLEISFPETEYRNPLRIKTISEAKDSIFVPCIICNDYDKDGDTENEEIGILSYWDFRKAGEDFIYVEHLAMLPKTRNKGYGTCILKDIRKIHDNIIFEVESPEDEMSTRRVNFYLRNGAMISPLTYSQPPYRPETDFIPMKIMYFGNAPTERQISLMKHTCYPICYVEECIMPVYDHYDAAHRQDHIREVIRRSLEIAASLRKNPEYEDTALDTDMLYICAAYHDLGMDSGRETHHLASAAKLVSDKNIKGWFSPEEMLVMKDAIEDHRSSLGRTPRNIYGKILAEADRNIDPLKIMERAVIFSKSTHPELDRDGIYDVFRKHMIEKYGPHGYLKLIFKDTENSRNLERLREIISDENQLKKHFGEIYPDIQ